MTTRKKMNRNGRRTGMPGANPVPAVSLESSVALLYQTVENLKDDFIESTEATNQQIRELARGQEKQFTEFRSEMRLIANDFAASKKTNWPVLISALFGGLTFLTVVVGGGWAIIRLQTDNTVGKALADFATVASAERTKLRTDLDANTAGDKVSITERAKHDQEIKENREKTQALTAEQMVIKAQLAEVETQFRASDQARNVQFAEQQRMNNILMQLTKSGLQYPAGPYFFPAISDHGKGNGQ